MKKKKPSNKFIRGSQSIIEEEDTPIAHPKKLVTISEG